MRSVNVLITTTVLDHSPIMTSMGVFEVHTKLLCFIKKYIVSRGQVGTSKKLDFSLLDTLITINTPY
jgi:hypothetical protein